MKIKCPNCGVDIECKVGHKMPWQKLKGNETWVE